MVRNEPVKHLLNAKKKGQNIGYIYIYISTNIDLPTTYQYYHCQNKFLWLIILYGNNTNLLSFQNYCLKNFTDVFQVGYNRFCVHFGAIVLR